VVPVLPTLEDKRAPSWLPQAGKAEWRRVLGYLTRHHHGYVQALDRTALTAYAMTWATWLDAAQDVAKRGSLVPGRSPADGARDAGLVKNPSVQVMRDAGIQLRYWVREFGFSPDSRGRIDLPGPEKAPDGAGRLLS
jgi:P27 family predicted phage terminase small subunit